MILSVFFSNALKSYTRKQFLPHAVHYVIKYEVTSIFATLAIRLSLPCKQTMLELLALTEITVHF